MTNSDFSGALQGDTAANAYIDNKQVDEIPLRDLPAGGLNTTVEDLGKFLIAIHDNGKVENGTLLSPKLTKCRIRID